MNRVVSFAIGTAVLGGVVVASWLALRADLVDAPAGAATPAAAPAASSPQHVDVVDLAHRTGAGGDRPAAALDELIGGVVMLPIGRPAAGATVTLLRQTSAWPEWQGEEIDVALTGADGVFRFRAQRGPNFLVRFDHPDYAGDLVEAPACQPELVLTLQLGAVVQGIVTNDSGGTVAGARVALESQVGDQRRVRIETTDRLGRFRFEKVLPGAVRVVARHERWQPKVLQNVNVVVDMNRLLELRFERLALTLEGRVVSGATQEPVAGARVLALPPGQSIGQHLPAETVTLADGTFRLGGLSRGNLNLEVRHPDHAVALRTVVVGPAPTPLLFDLSPRVEVHGRLVAAEDAANGAAAAPDAIGGVVLTVRSAAGEIASVTAAADGTFVFPRRVTPGWATLRIEDAPFVFRQSGSSHLPVRVADQRNAELNLAVVPPAVVYGRVTDDAGAGIAGARVAVLQAELLAERLRQAGSALLERDLGKLGDQFARTSATAPETLLAVTGADGRFRIAGLPPGPVALRVAHPSHGTRRVELTVPQPGTTDDSLQVPLPRACRIFGHVLRGGRGLAGAQVWVVVQGLQISAVTGLDGAYVLPNLPPDAYRVRARYSTLPAVLSRDVARVTPTLPARVDLQFPPGRVVAGTVVGSEKQPVEGAMVLVRGETGSPAVTDATGGFQLDAPDRALELQVLYGDRSARVVKTVPANEDRVTIEIDTPPNCTISARVRGLPGHVPIQNVLLRIAPPGVDDGAAAVVTRLVELTDGDLRYPWFPAGTWRVSLWSEGYAPVAFDLQVGSGDERDLGDVLLEPGCTLHGRVVDEGGSPVPGAEVLLGDPADADLFQPQLHSAADGTFTVRGVCSAADTLVVRAQGFAVAAQALRLPFDVLAHEPVTVVLERGATIEVRVADDTAEGAIVVLRRDGRVLATADVDEAGRASFPNCAGGEYVVQRFGDEGAGVRVRVGRSGEPVRVDL